MNTKPFTEIKWTTCLFWAMIAFGFLGLEFGVLFISRIVDGRSMDQIGQWPMHWYGAIFHFSLTILVWTCGILLIYHWIKKKGISESIIDFKMTKKALIYTVTSILFVIVFEFVVSLFSGGFKLQIIGEFRGFQNMYESHAFIVTVFQVLFILCI